MTSVLLCAARLCIVIIRCPSFLMDHHGLTVCRLQHVFLAAIRSDSVNADLC